MQVKKIEEQSFLEETFIPNNHLINHWNHPTFYQVLDQSDHSIAIIGIDNNIQWINKTAEKWYGFSLHEVVGKKASAILIGMNTDKAVLLNAQKAIANKEYFKSDILVYNKDLSTKWIRLTVQPLFSGDEVYAFSLYGEDISQEKQAHLEIEIEKSRYYSVLNSIPAIILTADVLGKIIFLNQYWEKATGFKIEEGIGNQLIDFISLDDAHKLNAQIELILNRTKDVFTAEVAVVTKDKTLKWFEVTYTAIISSNNEIAYFSGKLIDITPEKEIRHYYEILSNNVGDFISIHEEDGIFIYASPSVKDIAGYDPSQLIGTSAYDYFHKDDLITIAQNHQLYLETGDEKYESITYRFRKRGGEFTWLETKVKRYFDTYCNKPRLVLCSKVADIKKQEEAKLQEALQEEIKLKNLKSEFINFVSHEFRTPLAIVKAVNDLMFMQASKNKPNLKEQILENVAEIDSEINRLTNIIDEVLILEKMGYKNLELEKEWVDIVQLVKECARKIELNQKDSRKVTLTIHSENPRSVFIDEKYIHLVISNLLSNAFKYSTEREAPSVEITFNLNEIELVITDFGIGIPTNDQVKIFNTFFRATNAKKIAGTGLGLSITKKFIEMHGGKVHFKSEENIGSSFTIILPYVHDVE